MTPTKKQYVLGEELNSSHMKRRSLGSESKSLSLVTKMMKRMQNVDQDATLEADGAEVYTVSHLQEESEL